MKLQLLFTFIGSLISYSLFSASGGPDSYGYVWTDSNEPGGPTYNWVDISTTGTLVTGLGDDNSAAAVSMGMNFHYYWGDYNQIKIGSNGWLSFENTSNIAHCFPLIPTAGGSADTYIAPFMSDLNFTGVGNTAEVYYEFDAPNDRFIVSYLNVPWWTANAPTYVGSNSFQVIFNNSDSSIVFQYENISTAAFNNLTTCSSDIVVGIEGPTGTIGLTAYVDALPPSSNYAIRFAYPNPVLLQVPDISAQWNSNVQSGGEFYNLGTTFPVLINVASVGNTDVTTSIGVNVVVRNIANVNVGSFNTTLPGGLDAGTDTTFSFDWTPPYVGQFKVETTISNSSDINSTNNARTTELEVINQQLTNSRISYVSAGNANTGTLLWTSGANQGAGIFIEPPSYPFYVDSIGVYIVQLGTNADITLELYAADGPNNSPGTLLHSEIIPSASVTLNGWVRSAIPNPAIINSNGMYIAWKQPDATNLAIGVSTELPLSRRGYEFLGSWAEYRDNELQELMLEAFGFSVCAGLDLSTTNVQHISCFGDSTGAINMTASGGVPGSSGYTYSWTNYTGNDEDPTNLGAGTYQVTVTDSLGCTRTNTVVVNQPTEINISVVSIQDVLCNGGISGAIDTDVSGGTPGTSGYTYSWTNYNGITGDASGIGAGSYTLTVTDENGCSVQETIMVNEPSAISVAALVTDEMSGGDGAIDLTVTGGVGPYQYSWTNGAGMVEDPSNLTAGTYIVTITDANGCVKTQSVIVGSQVGLSENNAEHLWSIYPNPTEGEFTVDLSKSSVKNGLIEVKDLSGRLIYSNEFSNDLNIQLSESGIYFVTIFNELGQSTKEIVVQQTPSTKELVISAGSLILRTIPFRCNKFRWLNYIVKPTVMHTISSILRTLFISSIAILIFTLITAYANTENNPVDLQSAVKAGTVSVKAVSNGKYSGNSIVLNLTNLTGKSQNILIPAGTLYYPGDEEEQTLIQLEDQLIVLQGKETKHQLIAGFCSESSDRCPSEENTFKLGKSTDPKLGKLIDYLKSKKVDKSTYQEAVWAITDAHPISSIYSEKTDIRDFRTFMADLTGQEDTWFSSPQQYALDNRGNINRETVRITGQLTFDSDGNSPIHQELCDEEGNVLFTSSSSTPRKSKDVKMSFSVRVQGWEKGNYFVKIMDGTTELKRFEFVI